MQLQYHVDSAEHYPLFFTLRCEASNMLWTNNLKQPDYLTLQRWYLATIAGNERTILIATSGDAPVGYLYLDREREGGCHTAIGVTERLAGKGLGTRMLQDLAALHPGKELRAWIYEHNIPSIRAHEKAGYRATGVFKTIECPLTQPADKRKFLYIRPAGAR